MVDKRTPHVYVEFEAKFGELWATRTLRETWWAREQFTFMWNLRQNLESSGHQEKYKSPTALRNRCCIDTKRCSGGYTQPQVLRLR